MSLSVVVPNWVNLIEPNPAHPPASLKKFSVLVSVDNIMSLTLAKKKELPLLPPPLLELLDILVYKLGYSLLILYFR